MEITLITPATPSPDAAILDGFRRWQTAHAERTAMPEDQEAPFWAIIDAAEAEIRSADATTPQGVAAKLWIALEHDVALDTDERRARTADIAAFADDEGQDWSVRLILSALRSLESMAAAQQVIQNYDDELDAIDRETARLRVVPSSEPDWDRWEEWTCRIWKEVEALPVTAENARIKARAAWSIISGDLDDLNNGQSTCCRLVRQIVSGLGAPHRQGRATFDPAKWLASFQAVGGGWVVRDRVLLVTRLEGQPDDDLIRARDLVADLTDENRAAILAHLRMGGHDGQD